MFIANRSNRGDTLVEVLLATVVLSIVLAGAYNLSARATRLNQQAFERTQVSNLLQGQSELLRAARDSQNTNPTLWGQILSRSNAPGLPVDCKSIDLTNLVTLKPSAFYMQIDSSSNINLIDDPTLVGDFYWIWVEGQEAGGTDGYVDFSINACWERQGGGEQQQSGIFVRLEKTIYETN